MVGRRTNAGSFGECDQPGVRKPVTPPNLMEDPNAGDSSPSMGGQQGFPICLSLTLVAETILQFAKSWRSSNSYDDLFW